LRVCGHLRISEREALFVRLRVCNALYNHYTRQWGEEANTLDGSAGQLDFHQAYLKLENMFGQPFSFTAGRQELVYGSEPHPKYKTKYRVKNWAAYDIALRERGDITVWFGEESIFAWNASPSGRPGGQRRYSDLAIVTA